MKTKQDEGRKHRRLFSVVDVHEFDEVSGIQGIHHVALDKDGRSMVQGLLPASLGTKIGSKW